MEPINRQSVQCRLAINTKETNYNYQWKGETINAITVNGQILEQVTSFTYHGHIIIDEGRSETEIKKRKQMVKDIFNGIDRILATREKTMLKIRIVKYLYSALPHGTKTMTIKQNI